MTKQHVHELIEHLDAGQLDAVGRLLEVMTETSALERSLAGAPVEEEETTDDTAAAIDRSRAAFTRGEVVPHADILREFGMS